MSKNNFSNVYDDDNIPEVDLPSDNATATSSMTNITNNATTNTNTGTTNSTDKPNYNVEPLPESSRPRKDGPGGA